MTTTDPTKARQAFFDALVVGMRAINAAGLAIINAGEGDKLRAYQDQRGIWTIGRGHTGRDVHPGLVITEAESIALQRRDLAGFCAAVDNLTHDVPTTDNQFSAMVSLTYNIGPTAFKTSHVMSYHRAGNHAAAADAFLSWDKTHINGQLVLDPPLLERRKKERALYLAA